MWHLVAGQTCAPDKVWRAFFEHTARTIRATRAEETAGQAIGFSTCRHFTIAIRAIVAQAQFANALCDAILGPEAIIAA